MNTETTNSNSSKLSISLSLTNPPRRIPIELPCPCPASKLHELASNATTIPQSTMRLIFRGKIIPSNENDNHNNVIDKFQLEDGSVVHCMGKPAQTVSSTPAAGVTATPNSTFTTSGSVVTPPASTTPVTPAAPSTSPSNPTPLKSFLHQMKSKINPTDYTTALTTISKLLSNIINNPMEEKYRKVKRGNAAFTKRLGRLSHSHDVMMSIGFITENNEGEYVLVPNVDAWPKLTLCKKVIDDEIQKVQNESNHLNRGVGGGNANVNAIAGGGIPDLGFGGIPPSMNNMFGGSGGGIGGGGAPTPQMMESMLSDPAALQSMLSNPMIQEMIRNDPRFNNNPMMQASVAQLLNNPSMISQVSSMMNDPNVRERMNSMMSSMAQQNGGVGGSGSGSSTAAPDMAAQMELMRQFTNMASSNTNNSTSTGGSSNGNNNPVANNNQQATNQGGTSTNNTNNGQQRQMTEEEMIAEAIARSMREQ